MTRDPERRLRARAAVRARCKTHPVGWLTVAGFEALDPAAFEIVGLAQAQRRRSDRAPLPRRRRRMARRRALDDAGAARRSRATIGIDLLIDLGGYGDAGADARLRVSGSRRCR